MSRLSAVRARQRLAVPELDQAGRDRDAVRGQHLAGLEGGAQVVAGEPAGLVDLLAVDLISEEVARAMKPSIRLDGNGQGWLATYSTSPTRDAGLLEDLAAHRLLDGLAGLDEAGERREAALGPVHLAAEQGAVLLVGDEP